MNEDSALQHLKILNQSCLLEFKNGRYRLHDLARQFARGRLNPDDQVVAERRHSDYYFKILEEASTRYTQGGDSLIEGLHIFDLERDNIQAGQAWAASQRLKDETATSLCNRYPRLNSPLLTLRQSPEEKIQWGKAGLEAARRLADRQAEAEHYGNLSTAYLEIREYETALDYSKLDLKLCRKIRDRLGQAQALNNQGVCHLSLRSFDIAAELFKRSFKLFHEEGDLRGQSFCLTNLGLVYSQSGDLRRARESFEQRLDIARKLKDLPVEA